MKPTEKTAEKSPVVLIDVEGLETRLQEVPVPPGNYSNLSMDAKRLYFISRPTGRDGKVALKTLALDNKRPEAETFIDIQLEADPEAYSAARREAELDAGPTVAVAAPAEPAAWRSSGQGK